MNNLQNGASKNLADIKDPNEFIAAFRAIVAEENQIPENDLFPLEEDSLQDIILNFFGLWLAMFVTLPVENREEIIAAINKMADTIKQAQNHIPDNPEQLKRFLLHCLRRGVAPYFGSLSSMQ